MEDKICITVQNFVDIDPTFQQVIDEIKVTGSFFDWQDRQSLHCMCNGLDKEGNRLGGRLQVLDLSSARCDFSYHTFEDCITLKSIALPHHYAGNFDTPKYFSGCKGLEEIKLDRWFRCASCKSNYAEDGILYINNKSVLVKYPAARKQCTIIHAVKSIYDYAFEDFAGCEITSLCEVPPSCTKAAFEGLDTRLITLRVPKGSKSSYWCTAAFSNFKIVEMEE